MRKKGKGWHGDRQGHREAALKANENWIQTRWRHLKERIFGGD
jgi:hypothetical protein